MSQFLPPNLLALFMARDMPPYMPPLDKLTHEKKRQAYTGLADFMKFFEDPEETPPPTKSETKQERLDRKRREKAEQNLYKIEQDLALWEPKADPNAVTDPFRTLFVARINYDTSESKLKREFEAYGKIRQIKLVYDKVTGKPRGYGFVEYENEGDMHAAYKRADGKKIDNKRVVVDIERGRTIKGWKPRRLGGGKGGRKSHFDPLAVPTSTTDRALLPVENVSSRGAEPVDSKRRGGDRDRDRDREKDKERKRDRSRGRSRSKSRDRKKRSKSRDRHRSRSKERSKKARRSKDRSKERKRSRSPRGEKSTHKLKEEHGNNGSSQFNHSSNGNGSALKLEPGEYVD